jgi:hypothetical protein
LLPAAYDIEHGPWFGPFLRRAANQDAKTIARAQAAIVRDLFGNPFRPATLAPACRTPDVVRVARAIYDGRRFEDLPVLADALEEDGCTNADLLEHCRGGGEHYRGCWAVDRVLGQE